MSQLRQKILMLYLHTPNLDSHVVAWSEYDGTDRSNATTGDSDQPPYIGGCELVKVELRLILRFR